METKEKKWIEITNEKVVKKTSNLATEETVERLLNHIVKTYEKDDFEIFGSHVESDEKIDIYLFWKKSLVAIVESKIETDNYVYYYYVCNFYTEEGLPINLMYLIHNEHILDISSNE